LLRPT